MNDAFGHPRTALILGGNSDIAHAVIRELASHGLERVMLATRNPSVLEERLATEPPRIEEVEVCVWDANDHSQHKKVLSATSQRFGDIDLVVCAVGTLGHASGIDATADTVHHTLCDNFTGPAVALTDVVHHFLAQGHGTLVVISSVAGLRPRRSNYVYGAAKAGLDAFTRGLQDATVESALRIHLIRPGFVATKMTSGLTPAPFATSAEGVAAAIIRAVRAPQHTIVHVPRQLGPIFAILRLLPSRLWRTISKHR